jgi:hypothetical protein
LNSVNVFRKRGFDDINDGYSPATAADKLPEGPMPEIRVLYEGLDIIGAELELAVEVATVPTGVDASKQARPNGSIAKAAGYLHFGARGITPQPFQYRQPTGLATLRQKPWVRGIQSDEEDFWCCTH